MSLEGLKLLFQEKSLPEEISDLVLNVLKKIVKIFKADA